MKLNLTLLRLVFSNTTIALTTIELALIVRDGGYGVANPIQMTEFFDLTSSSLLVSLLNAIGYSGDLF